MAEQQASKVGADGLGGWWRRFRASVEAEAAEARAKPANRRYGGVLAILLILVGALDAFSTQLALATGLATEANPLVAAIQAALGDYWVLPKMIVHGLLAAGVAWFPNRLTLVVMSLLAVLIFCVSLNNFAIFHDITSAVG